MRKFLIAVLASAGLVLSAVSAHADHGWTALDTDDGTGDPYPGVWAPGLEYPSDYSSITGEFTAQLVWPDPDEEDAPNLGTSIEIENLNLEVDADTEVSVTFEGVHTCSGGAPRVFFIVDGVNYNSDSNCDGSVTLPAGTIGHAGVVYDNGVSGTVEVSNLTIGEDVIPFKHIEDASDDDDTDNGDQNGDDTNGDDTNGEENGEATPTPTTTPGSGVPTAIPAGSTLPETGPGLGAITLVGLFILLMGAVVLTNRQKAGPSEL